jgi:hypothetical protein
LKRAVASGQNVVVTHHPVALSMPDSITAGGGVAGVLFSALDAGIALINAHTSLDRDEKAQRRLPELLGLVPLAPLETALMPMAVVTTFVPPDDADRVVAAMGEAGAGHIGDYTGCSFSVEGVGRFDVPAGGHPAVGGPGSSQRAGELRVEMVCAQVRATAAANACAAAHPYEEPLIIVTEAHIGRNAASLGLVSEPAAPETLRTLGDRCLDVFGVRPRVWGDPDRPIARVATTTGSGGSLIGDVLSAGADVLVTGEVRYHDAMTAAGRLAIIELGHDVSEWPLVSALAEAVRDTPRLDPACVAVESASAGWWTP